MGEVARTGCIDIPAGEHATLLPLLDAHVLPTRAEDGCLAVFQWRMWERRLSPRRPRRPSSPGR